MKLNDLIKLLEEAQDAYYNSAPIMSDAEFDELVDQLREIGGTGLGLYLRQIVVNSFMKYIQPHIIESMQYKIKFKG